MASFTFLNRLVLALSALAAATTIVPSIRAKSEPGSENRLEFSSNRDSGSAKTFFQEHLTTMLAPISIFPVSSVYLRNQKLTVSIDAESSDGMGSSVAVSGDTAVVGISGDDVGSNDNQGSAVVFVRVGGSWVQQGPKLVASDGRANESFGSSVAIVGNAIIVGAPTHSLSGDPFHNNGAAYVFTLNSAGVWTEVAKIINSTDYAGDNGNGDIFGERLGTDGTNLVISARHDLTSVGEGSVAYLNSVPTSGPVTVPVTSKVKRGGSSPVADFGFSVDVLGSTVFVGVGYGAGTTGEVLVCTTGTCASGYQDSSLLKRITGPTLQPRFGHSVAVDGNTLVIGETGFSRKVYITEGQGSNWTDPVQLDSTGDGSNAFGYSVAIDDDLIAVGRPGETTFWGRIFVFRKINGVWTEKAALLHTENITFGDTLGNSVAVDGNRIVGGAPFDGHSTGGAVSIFLNVPSRQFDFGGDGLANIAVQRPQPSPSPYDTWYVRNTSGGYTTQDFGITGDMLAPADFDGDGKTDVAVFRPSDGTWYVQGTTQGFFSNAWGQSGDIPVPNDLNGDGKADFVVFRPSTSTWYWKFSSDQSFSGLTCSAQSLDCGQTDIPIIGDFDGNQRGELAFFRPSTGLWQWYDVTTQAVGSKTSWGTTDDIAVPADYDGDLKTDFVIFRPSNSTWYRWYSSLDAYSSVAWGETGDVPVPADYDGDGETDLAVFRPGNNTWYIINSSYPLVANQTSAIAFGASGDVPIPSVF